MSIVTSSSDVTKNVQTVAQSIFGDDPTLRLKPFVEPASNQNVIPDEAAEHMGKFDPTKTLKTNAPVKIDVTNMNFWYGSKQALKDINIPILQGQVTALIGPSGCGKSTFLRTLNRMNDLVPGTRVGGDAIMDGINIFDKQTDVVLL